MLPRLFAPLPRRFILAVCSATFDEMDPLIRWKALPLPRSPPTAVPRMFVRRVAERTYCLERLAAVPGALASLLSMEEAAAAAAYLCSWYGGSPSDFYCQMGCAFIGTSFDFVKEWSKLKPLARLSIL